MDRPPAGGRLDLPDHLPDHLPDTIPDTIPDTRREGTRLPPKEVG